MKKKFSLLKKKTIILVHKSFLADQWSDRIREFLPDVSITKVQGTKSDWSGSIVIAMIQTVLNREIPPDITNELGFLIADECHHLAEESNWGESFLNAFSNSRARLITSGTPFRTDGQKLPWARYYKRQIDLSPPDAYSYGYGFSKWNMSYCALADRVVRDVVIHSWDWEVNFLLNEKRNGQIINQTPFSFKISENLDEIFKDEFDPETGRKIVDNSDLRRRVKAARRKGLLECGTEKHRYGTDYVKAQLIEANKKLDQCRRFHPWAGGLIICDDIEHADNVAKALKHHTNEEAVVIHSDAPNDKRKLRAYRKDKTQARAKWIIAVGKISEGVDIKFLRVCVYMTTITAALRWTQIIGRILRTEKEIDW